MLVGTEEVDLMETNSQRQERWPQRAIAIASSLLVAVTLYYTHYASEQTKLTTDVVALMRSDQRPWLGYHGFAIQARESPTSPWVQRMPAQGEEIRAVFFLDNAGKTPAVGVQRTFTRPRMVGPGEAFPDEPKG